MPRKEKNSCTTTRRDLRRMADRRGFIYRKGRKTPSVRIFKDGTIIRADADLSLCKPMKVWEAARLLGLE